MAVSSKFFPGSRTLEAPHEEHDPREHLMLDPKPRGEMNGMVMESMTTTSWKFWVVFVILSILVATCLVYAWGYLIAEGLGVAGVMRPSYWGIFLVNTVFWIGISHAGTFISAILRVFKAEFRRPFTRAASAKISGSSKAAAPATACAKRRVGSGRRLRSSWTSCW